jgi:predicted metal-dependent peptidase
MPWEGWDKDASLRQHWREQVASAAAAARKKGKLPGYLEELISGVLPPMLNWKDILRNRVSSAAKNDFRWNPPNKKHLYRGYVLPGISGSEIKIAVAIDTSGSLSSDERAQFLSEIEAICTDFETYTLHLYAADARIQRYWELHEMDTVPRQMPGGGGTDFRPVFEDLTNGGKDFSALIYLTDLWGEFPEKTPEFPVIWISATEPCPVKVPFGEVIHMPRRE